jgi:erythromycin esterase
VDDVRAFASPLRTAADLDPVLDRVGDARIVLLGEASHGRTSTTRGGRRSPGG